MSVGVDAHIDPAMRNCKFVKTIGANAHHSVGADDPVRPWGICKFAATYRKNGRAYRAGRCGHRPLQTLYGFALVRPGLRVHTAGRTEASAPTGRCAWLPVERAGLRLRPAGRGRTPPLRNGGRFYGFALVHSDLQVLTAQSFRHGFAVPPPFTQGRRWMVQTWRQLKTYNPTPHQSASPTASPRGEALEFCKNFGA